MSAPRSSSSTARSSSSPGRSRRSPHAGVKLDNGKELPADVIVYATGYNSMNGWVADICGQEMADNLM
jgi:hypothetical protein